MRLGDIAAAEGTDESSGVPVLTRSQSDNHYLVPFQQGSNIPVKIHNNKSVLKNCYTQIWRGSEKESTRKNGNSKLQPLVASIKTVLTKKIIITLGVCMAGTDKWGSILNKSFTIRRPWDQYAQRLSRSRVFSQLWNTSASNLIDVTAVRNLLLWVFQE